MHISRFEKSFVIFRTIFSFLLTAGFMGQSNAMIQGRPSGCAFSSSTIQIRE